jgi:hypothetical protein
MPASFTPSTSVFLGTLVVGTVTTTGDC